MYVRERYISCCLIKLRQLSCDLNLHHHGFENSKIFRLIVFESELNFDRLLDSFIFVSSVAS
jgi:hypothetical protein